MKSIPQSSLGSIKNLKVRTGEIQKKTMKQAPQRAQLNNELFNTNLKDRLKWKQKQKA